MANSKIINTTIEIYELDLKNEFLKMNFPDIPSSMPTGMVGCCESERED